MKNVNVSLKFDTVSELLDSFSDVLPDGYESFGGVDGLSTLGPDALASELISALSAGCGRVLEFFLLLLGASMLCYLASALSSGISAVAEGGVCAVVSAAIFSAMYPLVSSVTETLELIGGFFSALAPIITSMLALGGGASTAASGGYGMSVTVWLLGLISGGLLPPVMAGVFVTSTLSVSLGGSAEATSRGMGSILSRVIGIIGSISAAVFALQTYVVASADSIAMRAARYAAGALIPTVGASVSGALSTLVGGLSYTSGIIGASSVAVITLIAISPLAMLLLYRLTFLLCSLITSTIGRGAAKCVSVFGGVLDMLISVYVMTTMIYIFEILMLIWGGNRIFGA